MLEKLVRDTEARREPDQGMALMDSKKKNILKNKYINK